MAGVSRLRPSIQFEVALLQRHQTGFIPILVTQIKHDEARNHQVAGDEVEPGEYGCLEHADIRAEQHDDEQHYGEPGSVGEELRFESEVIEAAALRDPGLAKAQVADRDAQ